MKNRAFGLLLSVIIPGLGMVYAGNARQGLKIFGIFFGVFILNLIILTLMSLIIPIDDTWTSDLLYRLGWVPLYIAYGWQLREVYLCLS